MTDSTGPSEQPEIKPTGAPVPPIEIEPVTEDEPTDPDGLWKTLPLS